MEDRTRIYRLNGIGMPCRHIVFTSRKRAIKYAIENGYTTIDVVYNYDNPSVTRYERVWGMV